MCLQFIFFNLLVSFDVTLKWVSGDCVCDCACVCMYRTWLCGNLVRPPLNKESGFGCQSGGKKKTPKHMRACLSRQPDTSASSSPFLRRDASKVVRCLKASFRAASVTPRLPSTQLPQRGVGKHSRRAAADVKLLTLSKRSSKLKYRSEKYLNFREFFTTSSLLKLIGGVR